MTHTPVFRKTLIALALASAAMGSAQAQSSSDTSVTLYGALDATVESVRAKGATAGSAADVDSRARVQSNSSFIGVRGSEQLSSDLRAKFQFETEVAVDGDRNGQNFNKVRSTRDAFVGLQSERLGELRIGQNTSPYRSLGLAGDFNPSGAGVGSNIGLHSRIGSAGVNPGFDDRMSNSVHYRSPTMAGLSLSGIYGANEARRPSGQSNNHAFGLGADYARGDLRIGYAYERRNDALLIGELGGRGSFSEDVNAASVGHRALATYDFKVVKLGAMYDRSTVETAEAGAASGPLGKLRRDSYGLMASAPLGAGELVTQFSRADTVSLNGADIGGTDARMFSVGYNYPLSKRTVVKAIYSQINNSANAGYDFYPHGGAAVGASAGSNPRAIGVGVRHAF